MINNVFAGCKLHEILTAGQVTQLMPLGGKHQLIFVFTSITMSMSRHNHSCADVPLRTTH